MWSSASNDFQFARKRSRTLPIPESVTSVPNYPTKLRIYQTLASRYWQVRCFFNGKTIVRSLKTTNKKEALTLAKAFYEVEILKHDFEEVKKTNLKVKGHKVEFVAQLLLNKEQARADRAEISPTTVKVIRSLIRKHILFFFSGAFVEEISTIAIQKYFEYLCNLKLKTISLAQNLTILRKILVIAKDNKWINELPKFPAVKKTSTSRGGFTVLEYKRVLRAARDLSKIKDIPPKVSHRTKKASIYAKSEGIPHEMVWLVRFMVNSFVRPVDIKVIQHQHVTIVRGDRVYLRLSLPETKRHKGQIITLPAAVHVYETLKAHFDLQGLAEPTDYLFLPKIRNRSDAMPLIEKYFRQIMTVTGLRAGRYGQNRTLYSLRHSSITFRLLYGKGIDLLTLARNARTSMEMIDRHYASELTAELNVDMLHSRRKSQF